MGLFGFLGNNDGGDNEKSPGANLEEHTIDFKSNDDSRNFRYLDDLISSGKTEIILDSNIVLDDAEESIYSDGIKIVGKTIIIDGNFNIIDAKCKSRIFDIEGCDVTILNLKFQNANDIGNDGYGGAIRVSNSLCSIDNCEFEGNKIEANKDAGSGGAIASFDSDLNVSNSLFNRNFAKYHGGAIHCETDFRKFAGHNDGKVGGDKNKVGIHNCQFNDNVVENGEACGGAICIRGPLVNISNSRFANNKCEAVGGAIDNDGILSISNCEFRDNLSDHTGGAICNYDYETEFSTLDVSDSTFEHNKSNSSGGAIDNMFGGLSVRNCRFSNNSSGSGGAISTVESNEKYYISIDNCTFDNNFPKDIN